MHGMSQDRWDAALTEAFRTRVNFSDTCESEMIRLYDGGESYAAISFAVQRHPATVRAYFSKARMAGVVGPYRPAVAPKRNHRESVYAAIRRILSAAQSGMTLDRIITALNETHPDRSIDTISKALHRLKKQGSASHVEVWSYRNV